MGSLRWDVVRRLLPATRGAAVLEVGCGQGAVATRLADRYDYLGVELDPVSARTAQERLEALGAGEVRLGDLSVVEPGRTFDLVVAFEVLEHIEDDVAAAAQWVERLRPGGRLILSVPAYQSRYGPMDSWVGHYRRYEPAALAVLLRGAGLDDVTVRHYGMPMAYAIEPARNLIARRRMRKLGPASTLRGPAAPDGAAAAAAPPGRRPRSVETAAGCSAGPSMAERTGHSGRTLQPRGRAVGVAIDLATAPAKAAQRRFPRHGPALVATGSRPAPPAGAR